MKLFLFLCSFFILNNAYSQKNNTSYYVEESWDTIFQILEKNDKLIISMQKGMQHYRHHKLLNTYKIIPVEIVVKKVAPCLRPPCPVLNRHKQAYYIEPWRRLLFLDDYGKQAFLKISEFEMDTYLTDTMGSDIGWKNLAILKQ